MAKYINKTQPTIIEPKEFINNSKNQSLIPDCLELLSFFEQVTGSKPVIWGNIVGYGKYHYISKACEADWFITGFAPRTSTIAIYTMGVAKDKVALYKKLGKFKLSGTCIHIKKFEDIDKDVLKQIIIQCQEYMKAKYKVEK